MEIATLEYARDKSQAHNLCQLETPLLEYISRNMNWMQRLSDNCSKILILKYFRNTVYADGINTQ